MTDLRLALRILRGSGAAGVLRLALMTVGFAFGIVVVIFLAAMPAVLDKRGEVSASRQPLIADSGTPVRFRSQVSFGSWGGVRFTRMLVAVPQGEKPPTTPGLTRLPSPGEVFLSPSATALAGRDGQFARLVPGQVAGEIGPAGLLGPDELFAYVGVNTDELGQAMPSRGWGGFHIDQEVASQFAGVPRELLLIVTAPAVVYFIVCARLSAATRSRRYAALRLVGMSRGRLRKIAVLESGAAGITGGVLGLLAYYFVNTLVGPSGLLGFTWYPQGSRLSPVTAAFAGAVVVAAACLIGGLGAQRALARPLEVRRDGADRPPSWWYVAPFVFGLGLIVFSLLASEAAPRRVMDPVSGGLLIAGIVLATAGLLLALRPALVGLARRMAASRAPLAAPLAARIAARRLEHESSGLAWHLAGLCVLVMVGAVGAGALRQRSCSSSRTACSAAVALSIPLTRGEPLRASPDAPCIHHESFLPTGDMSPRMLSGHLTF